jgi:hypothetical protein
VAAFRDGAWSPPESIFVHLPDSTEQVSSGVPTFSDDPAEFPAIAWTFEDASANARSCVMVPTDSGFAFGEELSIPMTALIPSVTRDRNEDVWVAAWDYYVPAFYMHTYVVATSAAPRFDGSTTRPLVRWSLSTPAPGSWWAVLRAVGDGEFSPLARLRAGSDTVMSFTDSTAPLGSLLRYRIRRESVDKRYEWLSPEGTWWPRTSVLSARLRGPNPTSSSANLTITGAQAGLFDLRLYDLQGRLVLRQRPVANGSGQDALTIDLDAAPQRLRGGIYFVKVVDAAGRVSNSVKVAVVR